MTYIEFVTDCLKNEKPGNPIYTADIAKCLAKEYGMEINKANAAVAVTMKRLIDSKQLDNLRFYQKGIYYLTFNTPFGEMGINKEALIQHKYLQPDIGYEAGYAIFNRLGLTSQIPNERILVTNKAKECIRADKKLDVYIRPPKVTVTKQNKLYLQILDVMELMDKAPVDADNPYEILAQYLCAHNIQYQKLLALADRYYGKNTICRLAHIAAAGDVNI